MKGEAACGTLCQHPECWRADLRRVREAVRARNGIYTRKEDESRRNVGKSDSVQSVDGKCFIALIMCFEIRKHFGTALAPRHINWRCLLVFIATLVVYIASCPFLAGCLLCCTNPKIVRELGSES